MASEDYVTSWRSDSSPLRLLVCISSFLYYDGGWINCISVTKFSYAFSQNFLLNYDVCLHEIHFIYCGMQIELPELPIGEGHSYIAHSKDLRPSLDWTPQNGWMVPVPKVIQMWWNTNREPLFIMPILAKLQDIVWTLWFTKKIAEIIMHIKFSIHGKILVILRGHVTVCAQGDGISFRNLKLCQNNNWHINSRLKNYVLDCSALCRRD